LTIANIQSADNDSSLQAESISVEKER
jgi:hypothetical protein